jgi:hypothetical protein
MKSLAIVLATLALAATGAASEATAQGPAWFGVKPPPGLTDPPQIAAAKGKVLAPPVPHPAGEKPEPDFAGALLDKDMRTVAAFALPTTKREQQFFGRISGYPQETRTAEWLADGFRKAGLSQVEVQTFDATAEFWQPNSWEVRIKADPAFGAGSKDIVLQSAVPVSRSRIDGVLTAPLVFAGEAGDPVHVDVKGKIAVQHSRPTTGAYSDRAKIRDSGQALMKAGAVAVFNWVEQAGNMHVFDFGNCGGPCFNLGGADGQFLKDVLAKWGGKPVTASLTLDTTVRSDLKAQNVIATIPGKSSEVVIVNAHIDSWFSGAGDNADGVAVLAALARHYAKPENKPARTLIFVGSAGHHSPGLGGPPALLKMNKDRLAPTVLVLNLEHVAQMQIRTDPWRVDPVEEPKNVGVSNSAPAVLAAFKAAAERYGFTTSQYSDSVPGDLGGYTPLGVARVQAIHSGPLYHTSGDVPDSISVRGLERAARTYTAFIDAICALPADQINPPINPKK